MKYGYFDDENKEYVITEPETPYPWINYIGCQDFYGLISNTAGGYSFYKDARLRRITRYRYNNVPLDSGGRYFYIKEDEDIWSPSYRPVKKPLSFYECRHGLSYTKITGERNKLRASELFFVPLNKNCEVHKITLTNNSDKEKNFSLFSFAEFCSYEAYDDMTNFQRNFSTGEVEIKNSTIYYKTEYRERRNHYSFYSMNEPMDGFETDRESFIGMYNGFEAPRAVVSGAPENSIASGWSPIASHFKKLSLKPMEKKTLIFILGYIENDEEYKWEAPGVINKKKAEELIESLKDEGKVNDAFLELKAYWEKLLSNYHVESSDKKLDRMVNIWNQYQCMVTFNLSRSASYFESGIGRGMGFRDSNQDILGFIHQIPDRAKERILDLAATQFKDGSSYHQYQPLTKKGNDTIGKGFNDDPLWLVLSTAAYIKETGDFNILKESAPFADESKASLMDHLKASIDHVINNLGPHKLPLIGRADWNDCLNLNCFSKTPGESFQTCENQTGGQAESVFIAGLFVLAGKEYIDIVNHLNDEAESLRVSKHVSDMIVATCKEGYDGAWFLRAYDFYGNKIGSSENDEGKIFIEPQGMCTMAGIGTDNGLAEKALKSTEELLDTKYGIVLNYPAYKSYHLNLGEISSYPPGYKENGGIFCHINPWIMCGEAVLGHGDRAFEVYKKICPAYLEDISSIHKTEPYVYAQMIGGKEAKNFGEAKNSWLTGTAAWNFIAISQYILGIKAYYDGLSIDPCIPSDLSSYKVDRKFRGSIYHIEIKNPNKHCRGISSLKVDNKLIDGNLVPAFNDNSEHFVLAVID